MESNQLASPKVALIDYYTTGEEVIIFLIRKELSEPLVFRIKPNKQGYNAVDYLNLCAERVLVDFNGLPLDWKISPFIADTDRKRMEDSLKLEPLVNPGMRKRDPNYPQPKTYLEIQR